MAWVRSQRYRARAVVGQAVIESNQKTGTIAVLVMLEVTTGEQAGQRVRWRGYLNSDTNAQSAADELRAMGWKGTKWGDWAGMGSKECEFSLMVDPASDGSGKEYFRAAFVRVLPTLKTDKAVPGATLDDLNARLGGVLTKPSTNGAGLAVPPPQPQGGSDASEEIPF